MAARALAVLPTIIQEHQEPEEMADNERLLGALEQGFKGIKESLDDVKADIKELTERVGDVENIQTRLEGQERAVAEIENRLKLQEDMAKDHETIAKNNRRWVKGIFAGLMLIIGKDTIPHIFRWLVQLFASGQGKPGA